MHCNTLCNFFFTTKLVAIEVLPNQVYSLVVVVVSYCRFFLNIFIMENSTYIHIITYILTLTYTIEDIN